MASLHCHCAPSPAHVSYLEGGFQTSTSCRNWSGFATAAAPRVSLVFRNLLFGRSLRERLDSTKRSSARAMIHSSKLEHITCTIVGNKNTGIGFLGRRENSNPGLGLCYSNRNSNPGYRLLSSTPNVVSRASRMDDFIYLLSDYDGGGPIELPPKELDIDPFAMPEASPLQIAASFVLTGSIAFLLIRSVRRRAARAREMKFRSSGEVTVKSLRAEARKAMIDNLKKAPEIPTPPPTASQTAFGAVTAGVIALILYTFTTKVEASFVNKPVSQDYSVRNLTITVRTIITGLCYLATFVFTANAIGLTLYSGQILLGLAPSDPAPQPPSDPVENEDSPNSVSEDKVEEEDISNS